MTVKDMVGNDAPFGESTCIGAKEENSDVIKRQLSHQRPDVAGIISELQRAAPTVSADTHHMENKALIAQVAALRSEMLQDAPLTNERLSLTSLIPEDGHPNVSVYNDELRGLGSPTWLNTVWMWSECYMYRCVLFTPLRSSIHADYPPDQRRLVALFRNTRHWGDFDPFHTQKVMALRSSRMAVMEHVTHFDQLTRGVAHSDFDAQRQGFSAVCKRSLWGNATDLSLLPNISHGEIQQLQKAGGNKDRDGFILVNHLSAAFDRLALAKRLNKPHRRVVIVLDNAGFELLVDILLGAFLIECGLATTVEFHPKDCPWFVSDVIVADVHDLLEELANPDHLFSNVDPRRAQDCATSPQKMALSRLSPRLANMFNDGSLVIRTDPFWTTGGSYWTMNRVAPHLFANLAEADLVIFKGDMNYRKLTGDAMWPTATPFPEAIGPLAKHGLCALALRTCKSDVVVGLAPGQEDVLQQNVLAQGSSSGRSWAWDGKYALAQLSLGRKGGSLDVNVRWT
ncbi:hypothetical protein ANO11243_085000 [Dothideomycetidae sp. 11243]|nr:hypothetical protein ANO11243_085000 [fungal sp. No.11243]